MSELFLFGAGASVEANVPASKEMAQKIVEKFNGRDRRLMEFQHIVNFVAGGLFLKAGVDNKNPFSSGVDVEDLFSAVMFLAERDSLEMSPFVGSWHSMIELLDRIEPPAPNMDELFRSINSIDARVDGGRVQLRGLDGVKRKLQQAFAFRGQKPGGGLTFKRVADQMLFLLADLVWIENPERVDYISPLIAKCKSDGRMVIATLNYDNAVELACSEKAIPCNTGIDKWSSFRKCDFSGSGLQLIKLHGSIDWKWSEGKTLPERPLPHSEISKTDIDAVRRSGMYGMQEKPAVVFGQKNKLTAEGPFLELLRAFQTELASCQSLTVVGYSFRDAHINTCISDWFNESPTHSITIVDRAFEPSSRDDLKSHLRRLGSNSDRVRILIQSAGDFFAGKPVSEES